MQLTILNNKNKDIDNSMYSYQVTALNKYRTVIENAHEELIKSITT